MNINLCLIPLNVVSDNKEIAPIEEIPGRITEERMNINDCLTQQMNMNEQMNMNDYLTLINEASDNAEITLTEGIPGRITEEQMNMNDYLTPINETSYHNKEMTHDDTEQHFSRLVWF